MPNNKKRSYHRTFQLHKNNHKKIPKTKMSFKEAEERAYKIATEIPSSKNYLQHLQRQFMNAVQVGRGPIHCGLHNFSTDSWELWNKHTEREPHELMGSVTCRHCGNGIEFKGVPIMPGMKRRFQCKKCKKYTNTIQRRTFGEGPASLEIIG